MLSPAQMAAAQGWGKWPVSRQAREDQQRWAEEQDQLNSWFFFSGEVSDEQMRAVFRKEAHIARDKNGNCIVVEGAPDAD